jgi:hypothetical protein
MNPRLINVDCHNVHQIQAAGGVGGLNPSSPMDGPPICHAFIMLGKSCDIPTILLDLAMGSRLRSNVRVPRSETLDVFVKKLFCRDPCRNQYISGLKQKKGAPLHSIYCLIRGNHHRPHCICCHCRYLHWCRITRTPPPLPPPPATRRMLPTFVSAS